MTLNIRKALFTYKLLCTFGEVLPCDETPFDMGSFGEGGSFRGDEALLTGISFRGEEAFTGALAEVRAVESLPFEVAAAFEGTDEEGFCSYNKS